MGPKIQQYFVRYKREFVITVIVITEFDCILKLKDVVKFFNSKNAKKWAIKIREVVFLGKLEGLEKMVKKPSKTIPMEEKISQNKAEEFFNTTKVMKLLLQLLFLCF